MSLLQRTANSYKKQWKNRYMIHTYGVKAFVGTIVNLTCHSVDGGSFKILKQSL